MSNSVFVGREAEIHRLNTFLETSASGKAQIVFIAGHITSEALRESFLRSTAVRAGLS